MRKIVPIGDMNQRIPEWRFRRVFNKIHVTESGCWIWQGELSNYGYGRMWFKRKRVQMHRWMYEMLVGPIPEGLQIDHLCRVRACCNPEHLEPVTLQENRRRGGAAIQACRSGHPFDQSNTYIRPNGNRACRTCRRAAGRKYAANQINR